MQGPGAGSATVVAAQQFNLSATATIDGAARSTYGAAAGPGFDAGASDEQWLALADLR